MVPSTLFETIYGICLRMDGILLFRKDNMLYRRKDGILWLGGYSSRLGREGQVALTGGPECGQCGPPATWRCTVTGARKTHPDSDHQ